MALVPLRTLLDHAAENNYGVAAFNVNNMEQIQAIMEAADAAMAYVRQDLANTHDWSRKEEHVGKLLKLIERKFASA